MQSSTRMFRVSTLFTVVCCLSIATGNDLSTRAVQYEHLDLGDEVYKSLKSYRNGSFGFSPLGLEILLSSISNDQIEWNDRREGQTICRSWLRYKEPLSTQESIKEIMNNNFQDFKLYHRDIAYVAQNVLLITTGMRPDSLSPVEYREIDFNSDAESIITDEMERFSKGLIRHATPPGSIDRRTTVMSMDLWSFEGNFSKSFQKSRSQYHFYKNGRSIGRIPFLYLNDRLKYFYSDEMHSTIVEVPYKEEGFSMIAILPDVDAPANERTTRMNLSRLWYLLDRTDKRDVILRLPKFEVEASINLKNPLIGIALPVTESCFPLELDFFRDYPEAVFRNDMRQSIFFAVNAEESTTYPSWKTKTALEFNRPFSIVLRYKELALIVAEVTNPTDGKLFESVPFQKELMRLLATSAHTSRLGRS